MITVLLSGVIVGDNRFTAFNIGANGFLKSVPYRLLLSHTTHFGWFGQEYEP